MGFFDSLWKYLLVSSPYLLMGLFVAGIVHTFISVEKIKKWLGNNKLSEVFIAALVGIPLPLCSCSVIPTAVTLRKSGASNGATSAFLIATPESGVDSIAMTYGVIDLPMTIIRPVAAFCSAFVAGVINFWGNDFEYVEVAEEKKPCCSKNKKNVENVNLGNRVKEVFKFGYGSLLQDISMWLTIGILLGAFIDFVVPANIFDNLSGIQSRLIILAIGVPLYICASASTPIAASLIMKGLSPGAALLLLLVGPATNVSNIAVLQKYIGKKGVIINVLSIVIVGLVFSYATDWMYNSFLKIKISPHIGHQHEETSWFKIASVLIFVPLLIKGLYFEELKPRFFNKKGSCHV